VGSPVNSADNDDIPWGSDPAGADDAAPHSESNELTAGDRPNPFLRAAPTVPADAAAAAVAAARSPAHAAQRRMPLLALRAGFAAVGIAAVLLVVNALRSDPPAPAHAAATAAPPSSPAPTSAAPVAVAVPISRMTATVTITATTTAITTAITTATVTTRIPAAAAVTPTVSPRSQPPVGKTIPRSASVVAPAASTTPAAVGAPTRLSVSASGSAVPGGVAVTASVDTDGAPVTATVHLSGPQGSQQQFAMAPAADGGGTYSRTVHTGVGVVAVTVSATAGTRSASSAPFTVRVPS